MTLTRSTREMAWAFQQSRVTYDQLPSRWKTLAELALMRVHIRDGTKNPKGPPGRVDCTPGEFQDLIAKVLATYMAEFKRDIREYLKSTGEFPEEIG